MKSLITLFVLAFGFSAQASCPDVSGTFGAFCKQVDSCRHDSIVYYGVRIVQNSCDEVVIQRQTPTTTYFTATYPVGTARRPRGGNLSSFLNYTDDGLRLAIGGRTTSVFVIENFKKITTADGKSALEVKAETGSAYCQNTVECILPEK